MQEKNNNVIIFFFLCRPSSRDWKKVVEVPRTCVKYRKYNPLTLLGWTCSEQKRKNYVSVFPGKEKETRPIRKVVKAVIAGPSKKL